MSYFVRHLSLQHLLLMVLLVVEMGWLEAVASVSVSVAHSFILDSLPSCDSAKDTSANVNQLVLQRMAVLLASTVTMEVEWLAAVVRVCDVAACSGCLDLVLLVLRDHVDVLRGDYVVVDERWRLLATSLRRTLAMVNY